MLRAVSETGGQERQKQLMDWCLTMDYGRGSWASPCPLPLFALLLLQQRAQPVPALWTRAHAEGPDRISHPCHLLKDGKDLCVPIASTTGLGWSTYWTINLRKKVIFWPKQGRGDERFLFLATGGKYSFPNQFILLMIHHKILPSLLECCQHTWTKDRVFWYTVVFRAATKD